MSVSITIVNAQTASNGLAPLSSDVVKSKDDKMEWWRNDRFGMFIHWGIYAQFAGQYRGHFQKVNNGEWLMNRMKVPVQEYKDASRNFNPVQFNADEWAKMAKNAGMKYLVITAKHHDGFALFDTKASDWDIMEATPYHKDIVKALAESCKKQELKFGIYYSQDQDWGNPGGSTSRRPMSQGWSNPDSEKIDAYTLVHNGSWDPVQQTKTFNQYFDDVAYPQIKELMANYGKIAMIFWDTPNKIKPDQAKKIMDLVHQNNPRMITNDRLMHNSPYGDYKTPEKKIPALAELDGRDWETNMTMNDTWGYRSDDHKWKSTEVLVRQLVDIASKGGNFLLNIGPKADGTFPQESIDRLKEVGDWMKVNSKAIYGTRTNPYQAKDDWRITVKDNGKKSTLYVSVFNWPSNGKIILEGKQTKALSAKILGNNTELKLKETNGNLEVSGLPKVMPDKLATVIEIQLNDLAPKKEFASKRKMDSGSID